MKTILLLMLLPLIVLAEGTNLAWVDEEIAAIKPPRKGLEPSALGGLIDPFRAQLLLNRPPEEKTDAVVSVRPKREKALTLDSIINRRSVMIDGKWYKQNDTVYGYTITAIGYDSVQLEKKRKKRTLTLKNNSNQIRINAK